MRIRGEDKGSVWTAAFKGSREMPRASPDNAADLPSPITKRDAMLGPPTMRRRMTTASAAFILSIN
jgi:hypothetical protein